MDESGCILLEKTRFCNDLTRRAIAKNGVSRDTCKSGHRGGWDHSLVDEAFDPAAVLEQHMISLFT